jgi:hypothetical protein
MNVQVTDRSTNDRIDRTERYQDGTITKTGWADSNGYFNMTIFTRLHSGYESREQVTGYVYADGTMTNVQSRMISEQLPYAPQQYGTLAIQQHRNQNSSYQMPLQGYCSSTRSSHLDDFLDNAGW